jgi:energy-coupling factor transport system permease protein
MVAGLTLGSRRVHRTRYRASRWTWRDTTLVCAGLTALGGSIAAELLRIPLDPTDVLGLPTLPILPFVAILIAGVPGLTGSRPAHSGARATGR